jgi:hypothetical protein
MAFLRRGGREALQWDQWAVRRLPDRTSCHAGVSHSLTIWPNRTCGPRKRRARVRVMVVHSELQESKGKAPESSEISQEIRDRLLRLVRALARAAAVAEHQRLIASGEEKKA